jgi:hypothetical protein
LVDGANIQYTKETKAENGFDSNDRPENPQKSPPTAIAYMNDLLDEALKETFPASDPIAINVELESPEYEIATTPGSAIRLVARARPRGGGRGNVVTAKLERGSNA